MGLELSKAEIATIIFETVTHDAFGLHDVSNAAKKIHDAFWSKTCAVRSTVGEIDKVDVLGMAWMVDMEQDDDMVAVAVSALGKEKTDGPRA